MTDSLFDPLRLRETTIPNRIALSPMCQYSAEAGVATDWHRVHLGTRAVGGAGLVMTEATAVEPRGRITPDCLGIWSDEHAAALEPIVSFVESRGAVPAIQLAHAGRKGSHAPPSAGRHALPADHEDGWETISATDEPYPGEETAATSRMDADVVDVPRFAVGEPVRRRDAHEHRLVVGPHRSYGVNDLTHDPSPVLEAPAVGVLAVVRDR